jgi:hypothetical protein
VNDRLTEFDFEVWDRTLLARAGKFGAYHDAFAREMWASKRDSDIMLCLMTVNRWVGITVPGLVTPQHQAAWVGVYIDFKSI